MGRRAKGRSGLRLAHPAEGVALGVAGLLVAATLTISLGGLPELPGQETSVTTASGASPGAAAPALPETSGSRAAASGGSSAGAGGASAGTGYGPVQAARLGQVVEKFAPFAPSADTVVLPGLGVFVPEVAATQPWLLPADDTAASTGSGGASAPASDPSTPAGGGTGTDEGTPGSAGSSDGGGASSDTATPPPSQGSSSTPPSPPPTSEPERGSAGDTAGTPGSTGTTGTQDAPGSSTGGAALLPPSTDRTSGGASTSSSTATSGGADGRVTSLSAPAGAGTPSQTPTAHAEPSAEESGAPSSSAPSDLSS